MNNEDLVLKMILDESGFSAGMDKAVKQLGKFDGQVENTGQRGGKSLGGIWTSFVGNFLASGATKIVSTGIGMITSSIDGAISRVDTLNNSNRVFENMGFSATETSKTMDSLKNSIQGLPTPLDAAIQGVQLIASSTNDLGKSEQIFAALNNGILGFGGSTDMVNNALIQLSQAFSNGKIDAQTWNSMINSGLGPALNALAKQMGITTGAMKEGLSDGTISVEQFQDALIDLNKNGGGGLKSLEQIAKDSTAGIKTGIANMKTAIVRGVAEAITKIDEGLAKNGTSISQIITDIGSSFESGLKVAAEKIPPIIEGISKAFQFLKDNGDWLIPVLIGIAGALTTVGAINSATKTITNITSAVKTMSSVFTLLASPMGIAAILIGGLITAGILLYKNWDEISAGAKVIWGGISDFFKETFDNIKNWFSDMWSGFKEKAKAASDGVKSVWEGTKQWFSDLWESMKEAPGKAADFIKEKWTDTKTFFSEMWESVKQTTSDVWESITGFFAPYVETILAPFQPLIQWFSGLWESVKSIAGSYWEIIKSVIMGPILLLIDLVTGDFTQFKEDLLMLWTTIKDNAMNIFNTIKDTVLGLIDATVSVATNLWNNLKNNVINIWNAIVDFGKTLWNGFKEWFTTTIDNTVNSVKTGWNNLKQGTIDTFNATVQWSKDTWDSFKNWFSTTIDNIVQGARDGWDRLKQWTIDTFNNIVDGAKQAWEDLKQSVSDAVDSVTGIFNKLSEIDLWEAGKAIIDGFIKGLKSKWEEGKEFIGGIGDWIRDHKGPIEYDRKLLVDNGNAIMEGLNSGLMSGFNLVKSNVNGMAGDIKDNFDDVIGSPQVSVNGKATATVTGGLDVTSNNSNDKPKTGDVFNINLQALGELSDIELMKLGEKLVKIIKEIKDREEAMKGGAFGGI